MKMFLLLCLTWSMAHAAAEFKGKIVRNEVNGAPVAGASITAPGSNPVVSQNPHGDFVLWFPAKNPGERVTLSVAMTGMVVVNWIQLDITLPGDPDASQLTLILARETDREEMARRFFRLRSVEGIEANYRKLLEEGKQDRARLQKERDEAMLAAAKAAEDLAKVQPGQSSKLYENAMRLLAESKVDEALRALDEAELRRLSQRAQERKEQAERQLAEAVQGWRLRAKLLTTKFRFSEAERAYASAVAAAPRDFSACFDQANFLATLNRIKAATQEHERCLSIIRPQAHTSDVAAVLNNLGNLYTVQGRMEEARKAYEGALANYRQLARNNPDTYLPYVATALNNLGILHTFQNQMQEAVTMYEEVLSIRRQLAHGNPEAYSPDMAMTLNNLGNLYRAQNRMEEARQVYEAALEIYRRLARGNPTVYLPYIAGTFSNLGLLYAAQNRMEDARKMYEESLNIRRQLADTNPEIYLPEVASVLWRMGTMHAAIKQQSEAQKEFQESLEIYQKFAARNPEQYQGFVDAVRADLAKVSQ